VLLDNDAAAAAMGEAWKGGHGKKSKNLVAITLGTGVGIGVIANGQVVRAGRGLHPEASHIPIDSQDRARPCGCGNYGCIEAYLSGTHFARHVGEKLTRELNGHDLLKLARAGNADVLAAFTEYGHHLALAVRSLAVVFAPEVVVLGGGFAEAAPFFLEQAQSAMPELLRRYRQGFDLVPEIKISKLGEAIGVMGAACMAIAPTNKKGRLSRPFYKRK
jgi:glucokinase